MNKYNLLLASFFVLFLLIAIFQWIDYLIQNGYILENFASMGPLADYGSPSTNHTVDLPLTTTISCKNMCGPNNRCSLTGEQCSSDIDCYGCNPHTKQFIHEDSPLVTSIRGENDAGKLTTGETPTYSSLTTDIGTHAKLLKSSDKDSEPVDYFKGVNMWRETFDAGQQLFEKRYNPAAQSFMPNYPTRPSLSGEFEYKGPLAANDFL